MPQSTKKELQLFHCLPSKNDEWPKLQPFVATYCELHGISFRHGREVDKVDSTRAYPEVEIEFNDDSRMVIEHKNIFWPKDYAQRHRVGHQFTNQILEALRATYGSGAYQFSFDRDEIEGIPPGDVNAVVAELLPKLTAAKDCVDAIGYYESGEEDGEPGFGVSIVTDEEVIAERGPNCLGTNLIRSGWPDFSLHARALQEIPVEVARLLESGNAKFEGFEGHRKIFVLEFYGEWVPYDEVYAAIQKHGIPAGIDELWAGEPGDGECYIHRVVHKRIYPV